MRGIHVTSLRVDTSAAALLLFMNARRIIETPAYIYTNRHQYTTPLYTSLETHGEGILTLMVLT